MHVGMPILERWIGVAHGGGADEAMSEGHSLGMPLQVFSSVTASKSSWAEDKGLDLNTPSWTSRVDSRVVPGKLAHMSLPLQGACCRQTSLDSERRGSTSLQVAGARREGVGSWSKQCTDQCRGQSPRAMFSPPKPYPSAPCTNARTNSLTGGPRLRAFLLLRLRRSRPRYSSHVSAYLARLATRYGREAHRVGY